MGNERSPTDELQALVEQLGARGWKVAEAALAARGEAGIAAAIWGLCHPNVRVRGDVRALWIITGPMRVLHHCGRSRCTILLLPFDGWRSIQRPARSASPAP